MSDESNHPEDDEPADSEPFGGDEGTPIQGQIRHSNISARLPEGVGLGVFSNGVMILSGNFEVVLDFVLRMGEQKRIVSRCVLPPMVAAQMAAALQENIGNFERRFGPLPVIPRPLPEPTESGDRPAEDASAGAASGAAIHPENLPAPPQPPDIQDIYSELKIPEETLPGHYANAVLIRHSSTEFCLDFISNLYPRSIVSSRVFLAAPHVRPLLISLQSALNPPGSSQGFA